VRAAGTLTPRGGGDHCVRVQTMFTKNKFEGVAHNSREREAGRDRERDRT